MARPRSKTELSSRANLPSAFSRLRSLAASPGGSAALTARGVAELCGVELKTVHNWAEQNQIAHFRTPGRHLRFQAADVVAFLNRGGYDFALGGKAASLLVVAKGSRRTRLRRVLKPFSCLFAEDALHALVVAARKPPDALVVDALAISPLELGTYLSLLCREFQSSQVICLRSPSQSGSSFRPPAGVVVLGPDEVDRLLGTLRSVG